MLRIVDQIFGRVNRHIGNVALLQNGLPLVCGAHLHQPRDLGIHRVDVVGASGVRHKAWVGF